ncbi:protein kinase [Streptomyces sp. NPDC127108]|uniref:serine/threonine-protein kinase n=1 Tax=Streptomyces sp. NPDC127108 TaxID=3345361 RepID=UPI003624AE9A
MRGAVLDGRYQLCEPLGSGGMGTVWRARDIVRQRFVAVKMVFAPAGTGLSELARRFQREFAVASLLRSPHIVEVQDSGEAKVDGSPLLYLVMEEVPGSPLSQVLAVRSPSLAEIARWGGEICKALTVMHGAGIVHRDLKPVNVMIGPDGHATVLDFGIARLNRDGIDLTTLTHTGDVLGTVAFMSPEQAGGGTALDGRSDLYSLGCLLYATLVGRPPFAEGPWQRVLRQHVEDTPLPPSAGRHGLPPAWDTLLLDLLAKGPGDRPPNADAARERIAALPVPQEAQPEPPAPPEPGPAAAPDTAAAAVAPDTVTRGATSSPHGEPEAAPEVHPPTRLAAHPRAVPRLLPGDEVISRGLTGSQLVGLYAVVALLVGGLVTLILIASGRESGQSLGTSGLITAGGFGATIVGGFLYNAYVDEWKPLQARRRQEADWERAQLIERAAAASGAGSAAHQEAYATVSAAMSQHISLWVGYEHHQAIRWVHLRPERFDDGDLLGTEESTQQWCRIATFRLRATSDRPPPEA